MLVAQGQQYKQQQQQQQQQQSSNMSKVKVHNRVCRQEWTLRSSIMTVLSLAVIMTVQGQHLPESNGANNGIEWKTHPSSGGPHHPQHHAKHPQRHHQHREAIDAGNDDDGGGGAFQKGKRMENFLLIDYLNDGERERRISWNGIIGKETSLADTSSNKTLALWQMATPKYLMQIIYNSDGEMMDCEYVRQRPMVQQFHTRFYDEFAQARARNFTSPFNVPNGAGYHSLVSDHDFREYIDHDVVTPEMDELQYNAYEFPAGVPASSSGIDAFGMRNLTYIPLRDRADIPQELVGQLNFHELKQRCNVRHMQLKEIATGLRSSDPENQRIANEKLQRHKRAISDWFLSPNTKWCGKGHSAALYHQLGGASRADMCCRKHDHCKLMIPAMGTQFELFNFRPFTISHCSCDTRFRTCLKMADSSDANLVGKLFFNIVQMKCFVLKPETVCVKQSWWGKCEKKVRRKRAHLRDNRKF
uniref:phospholipase A2 n=1 Tax=Anopheles atroparvus TaxID=41427 RepID=A0AAG5DT90_ANOAO